MYCPHCCAKVTDEYAFCPFCGKKMTVDNESFQLPAGTLLHGRFHLGKVIGYGGFGITYLACDSKLEKKVAIKEFFPQGIATRISVYSKNVTLLTEENRGSFDDWRRRFINEARILASFSGDPHIVSVSDIFEENNTIYMVMDFIEGETLENYLRENGELTFLQAYEMLRPLMASLGKIHAKGLMHRDISPSNIMLTRENNVILLDFGAARTYDTDGDLSRTVILKPGYAPIEQYIRHGEQGPWSDVYAFCATLYRAVTGTVPPNSFERAGGKKEAQLIEPSKNGAVITPREEAALLKGLEIYHENRPSSMGELQALFDDAIKGDRGAQAGKIPPEEVEKPGQAGVPAGPSAPGPKPSGPEPLRPGPVQNGSVRQGPVRPEPVQKEPVRPEPVRYEQTGKEKKSGPIPVIIAVTAALILLMFAYKMFFSPGSAGEAKSPEETAAAEEGKAPEASAAAGETGTSEENAGAEEGETVSVDEEIAAIADAEVGDIVLFGAYEQDGEASARERIEWIVLEKRDGKAKLLSQYGLENRVFNMSRKNVTWKTCYLRTWLNEDFLGEAFSEEEQERIEVSEVKTEVNPLYGQDYDTEEVYTDDRIFLLNVDEAQEYFENDDDRKCIATPFAVSRGALIREEGEDAGVCWWWLRTMGVNPYQGADVTYDGKVNYEGDLIHLGNVCIRPVMWVAAE